MLELIRGKYGPIFVTGIIGFIAFVFIFSGVFNPKTTRGLHEGAVAGTVNGDPISLAEFNREYNRRLEFFKNMGGGKMNPAQLKGFKIKEGVFSELVNRKLMIQEAERMKLYPSDEEIRDKIREIPAFQTAGKFDPVNYRKVLEANSYTPGNFERLIREDLMMQQWSKYFKERTHVADEEIKQDYLSNHDKRNIKYVLLTTENGRKAIAIDIAEVHKYLADPAKLNLAKNQFEAKKDTEFKGKKFEEVKDAIGKELVASGKTDEIKKNNEKLADQILPQLRADKASDARVNALLRAYGAEVKSTGMITRSNKYLPGVGEANELINDAFNPKSPIDAKQGGHAKKYSTPAWTLVGLAVDSEKPDLTKLDKERDQVLNQIESRKERELYDAWIQKLTSKAKIDKNPSVVAEEDDGAAG